MLFRNAMSYDVRAMHAEIRQNYPSFSTEEAHVA